VIQTLQFRCSVPVGTFRWRHGRDLSGRYCELLATEAEIVVPEPERRLIDMFNDLSGEGDTVAGAAVMAGAVALRGVRQLQGGAAITGDAYAALAARFLESWDDDPAGFADPATSAMAALLRDPTWRVPTILARWRAEWPSRLPLRPPLRQGRNERCGCGSGSKYKHCHGS
jgi:hypothetical protein